MLERVYIENFRCFQQLSVPLQPLTVLVGTNDSGKTSFLAAIESLLNQKLKYLDSDFWRHDSTLDILVRGSTPLGDALTRSLQSDKGRLMEQPNEAAVRHRLLPYQRFQLPSTGVAMQCRGYDRNEESELQINSDGGRVPALLDHLLRRDRKRFFAIVESLRKQVPGFEDLEIATPDPESRRVDIVIEGGMRIHADAASTGVRMLIFFIALAYHPRPPKTILLEEPETGIHPKRLASVMQLLRDLTKGKYGEHPTQIILTTHSPYLLDSVNLDEDQVLVFQRNPDGSRNAQPVDTERLKTFTDEFMLGEVWFNEEEAGLIAKP